jgi:NAD(P)-dependent dehydrogenase (short-subunit alcohol dehydrogenase family)
MDNFAGKVAVVTGAASGIGLALSQRFAAEGMKVVLADVETTALDLAVTRVRASGADAIGVLTDVSNAEAVDALARRTLDAFGKVHIVCNNAGVIGGAAGPGGNMWQATLKDWQWMVGVNFWGVVNGVRTFVPILLEQDEPAHIVNTGSIAGLRFANAVYGITKHAVVAVSESLYLQLKQQGANIGVTVLCPDSVNTRIFEGDRNRPAELRNEVEPPAEAMGIRPLAWMQENGMDPALVADKVLQAIRDEKLYVLTHPGNEELVRERMPTIIEGRNSAPSAPPRR